MINFGACYTIASDILARGVHHQKARVKRAQAVQWESKSYNAEHNRITATTTTGHSVTMKGINRHSGASCSCPDRIRPCKHLISLAIIIINQGA